MSTGMEKRRSFRILESVYLEYKVISERDFNEGLERWKMRHGTGAGIRSTLLDLDARFSEKLFVLQSESRNVGECLKLLNDKINVVLDELPDMRESKAALAKKPPQTCEMGADGMLFAADQPYPPGTYMFVRFLLTADSRYVETFCRVVRNPDPPNEDCPEQSHGVAVEFQGMKSAEKDMLVQHLFNKESETLRMRRLKIEAVE